MVEETIELSEDETREWLFLSAYNWKSWAAKANALRKSALVLWKVYMQEKEREYSLGDSAIGQSFDLEHEETAMMLMGMALENLIKSLLIIKNPALIINTKINPELETHDLVSLIRKANIEIDKLDTDFCKLLTDFIVWQGRYPVPKKSTKLKGVFRTGYDWKTFDNLYIRIFDLLAKEDQSEADHIFSAKLDGFWKRVDNTHNNS